MMKHPDEPSWYQNEWYQNWNGSDFLGSIIFDDVAEPTAARVCHYENTPIQLYWKFYHQKMKNFW